MERRMTSCDLASRRSVYKLLDKTIRRLWQGPPPQECDIKALNEWAPMLRSESDPDGTEPAVWAQIYGGAVDLIKHDDNLNWQKFYHMLYLNAGLLTAFVFAIREGAVGPKFLFPILGIAFGILFDLTLQEGMRCLRAHKQKVVSMDHKLGINRDEGFLFLQNPYNHRDALEAGPLLFALGWTILLIVSFWI